MPVKAYGIEYADFYDGEITEIVVEIAGIARGIGVV